MTKVIARVHTVHDECRPKATNPQTKPSDIGCESAENWLLPSTSTIAIVYYYLARKLIIILPSHAGWKAKRTAAHAQGCISQWLSWLTQPSAVWFEPGSSHTAVRRANHSANVLNFKPRLYFSHFCKKKTLTLWRTYKWKYNIQQTTKLWSSLHLMLSKKRVLPPYIER